MVAVADCAKNLNQTSLPDAFEPPGITQVGAGAQGSIAVVGSNAAWLENEVPPAGQPDIHVELNTTAFENSVPPPNICDEAKKKQLSKSRSKKVFCIMIVDFNNW